MNTTDATPATPDVAATAAPPERWPARPGVGWIAGRSLLTEVVFLAASLLSALIATAVVVRLVNAETTVGFVVLRLVQGTATVAGVAVAFALVAHRLDRSTLRRSGFVFGARSIPAFLVGLTAALVVPAGALVLQPFGLLRPNENQEFLAGTPTWAYLVTALASGLLVQALPEELAFRGYLLRHTPLRIVHAIWLSAAVFGLGHLLSAGGQHNWLERVIYLAGPFGFAMLAGALAARMSSLWAAVGVHLGSHVGDLVCDFLNLGSSPAAWVFQGVVWTVAALLVMRTLPRDQRATDLQDA